MNAAFDRPAPVASRSKQEHRRRLRDSAAAYQARCREWERTVLGLLQRKFSVETGFTIKTRRKSADGSVRVHSYEIDFVLRNGPDLKLIGELKLSSNPSAASKQARKQLQKRIRWASLAWPGVKGLALCYHLPSEGSTRFPRTTGDHDELGEILCSACLQADVVTSHTLSSDKLFKELAETGLAAPNLCKRLMTARRRMDALLAGMDAHVHLSSR